ncbi:MAG: DNA polymerase III subunit epsilon [Succinivibrionaceae bacterium]|nr:DNA polymerase III subunit epsilon [Succinivibrionaceae bacterium]
METQEHKEEKKPEVNEKRWVFLDTETTGKSENGPAHTGHRVIEIGAVEVYDRNFTGKEYRQFLNPEMKIDAEAMQVHGITDEFVADKPLFKDVAQEFVEFVRGSVLIIHNAKFDVGFLNQELAMAGREEKIETLCTVVDSYAEARKLRPGHARYSLDALCEIFNIDNSNRTQHGALLDAKLLAEMYLALTGGQKTMSFSQASGGVQGSGAGIQHGPLKVVRASPAELEAHEEKLKKMMKKGKTDNWHTYWL